MSGNLRVKQRQTIYGHRQKRFAAYMIIGGTDHDSLYTIIDIIGLITVFRNDIKEARQKYPFRSNESGETDRQKP